MRRVVMSSRDQLAQNSYIVMGPAYAELLRHGGTGLRRVVTSLRERLAQNSYVIKRLACAEWLCH